MWIIIGLGNPGRRYSGTRHNVGFILVRRLARRWGVKFRKRKYGAKVAEMVRPDDRLVLAQPQTYMNRSGLAVKQIMEGYRVSPQSLIVVYDDLDIPIGQIRIRKEGRAGSHKGMGSIVAEIGTSAFPRLRVGIGPQPEASDATEFVLSPFSPEEMPVLEEALRTAEEALEMMIDGRIDAAMNAFNQKGMN
ncbi:MAG: aminoacyl-tRNA hydrolase [Candidatus Aminicenantales bacterium]